MEKMELRIIERRGGREIILFFYILLIRVLHRFIEIAYFQGFSGQRSSDVCEEDLCAKTNVEASLLLYRVYVNFVKWKGNNNFDA